MRSLKGILYSLAFLLFICGVFSYGPSTPRGDAAPRSGFLVRQGGSSYEIAPLRGEGSAQVFYNYTNYQANTGLELSNHSLLFLYRDISTGELSLFIIHDAPNDGTGGSASFSFSGLPQGAKFAVMDDADTDVFSLSPPSGKVYWYWLPEHTDGLVISGLGEEFEITITPTFIEGIASWDLLTGDINNPQRIRLPNLEEPVTIFGHNGVSDAVISASRTILTFLPNMETLVGDSFKVRVVIRVYREINGLGLDEDLPPGWEVKPLQSEGISFKPSRTQWIFGETIKGGEEKTIVYEVLVAKNEEPDLFRINGRVISASPDLQIPVGGDSLVKVIAFLPIKIAISRLDTERGVIDVTLSNRITFQQILAAVAFWLEDKPVPGTNGRIIDFKTMLELIAHWLTDTPVDKPLPGS